MVDDNRMVFERDATIEKEICQCFEQLEAEVSRVYVGERELIRMISYALLAEGSIITESTPGEGKSLLGRTIAAALKLKSAFCQFKADTTPQELLGYVDLLRRDAEGKPFIKFGPIFTNLLIADELNRAPSKVKSPLLAAMQEHIAVIPGDYEERRLPRPWFVFATRNDIETSSDVYGLGQAEVNRFDMEVQLPIQTEENLKKIIPRNAERNLSRVQTVVAGEELLKMINYVGEMASRTESSGRSLEDNPIVEYIARLARASHFVVDPEGTPEGASSRAATRLWKIMNAYRVVEGREYLTATDVQKLVPVVWKHRIIARDKEDVPRILRETLRRVSPIPHAK